MCDDVRPLNPEWSISDPEHPARRLAAALGKEHPPTDEQVRVIDAGMHPLLVVAGAGSGKTTTMGLRVAHLVNSGAVGPGEVLGLTFTRKATSQLAGDVRSLLSILGTTSSLEAPTVATYNAFAAQVARDFALRLGEDPDAQLITDGHAIQIMLDLVAGWERDLSIFTSGVEDIAKKAHALASQVRDNLKSVEQVREELLAYAHQCAPLLGKYQVDKKTALRTTIEEVRKAATSAAVREVLGLALKPAKDSAEPLVAIAQRLVLLDIVEAYEERKRALGVMEFSDQVAIAARVAELPEVQETMRQRYRLVLLDEFQDTSVTQLQFLLRLFGTDHSITAVGDPNQAIYGWRGASAQALADFQHLFASSGAAATLPLNTAFRNATSILTVANHVAAPLSLSTGSVPVPELSARKGANEGQVSVHVAASIEEEGEAICDAIEAIWQPGRGESLAILARRGSSIAAAAEALRSRGIPHEIAGLKGLLAVPEVADVRALLEVAADASRGDSAMRLLTRARLSLTDLDVVNDWARRTRREECAGVDVSLVEVLAELPRPGFVNQHGHELSETARARLTDLQGAIRQVRAAFGSHLEDIVAVAERALRADIDVLARPGATSLSAHRHLDRFRQVARDFVAVVDAPDVLAAFLAYLDSAESEERGLEQEGEARERAGGVERDVLDEAVQLMTIHAAKGLEFDHVIVSDLVEGAFPSHRKRKYTYPLTSKGWLTNAGELPYRLRLDHDSLPEFTGENNSLTPSQEDEGSVMGGYLDETGNKRLAAFAEAVGAYRLQEERRLAYVAFTRAKHTLVLTAAWWASGTTMKAPSRFLLETLEPSDPRRAAIDETDAGPWWTAGPLADTPTQVDTLQATSAGASPLEFPSWPEPPEENPHQPAPPFTEVEAPSYPGAPPAGERLGALQRAAADVRAALERRAEGTADDTAAAQSETAGPAPSPNVDGPDARQIRASVAELLTEADLVQAEAERAANISETLAVTLPGNLSATQLQWIARSPEDYLRHVRRPLPARPTSQARLGTEFHRWVEDYYTREGKLDLALAAADHSADATLAAWQETFLSSRFAQLTPEAVEESVVLNLTVAGRVTQVRCKIDAVFATDSEYEIVDWKTGRVPVDAQDLALKSLQLQIYRHAFAAARDLDAARVGARFYYVAEDLEVSGPQADLQEIADRLAALDELTRGEVIGAEVEGHERLGGQAG
ncbi:MAG: UvrD-helicase domain-containing protein [Bowdeniella nasicola]|nr:UvrD-helicase domain-containing protein [Bowdeniella nasicola]